MVEMFLSFSVFCLLATFISIFFSILLQQEPIEKRIQRLEWELFVSQMKKEVQRSDSVEVKNNQLMLIEDENKKTFQMLGRQLRRQVNYQGNEVVLQNIETICFEINGKKLIIEAVDIYENTYTAALYPFISKEIAQE